jgi:hypothetical protein
MVIQTLKFLLVLSTVLYGLDLRGNEAIDKAIEAGIIQTGLDKNVKELLRYGKYKAESWGLDKEVVVIGYVYNVYKIKAVQVPVKNNLNIKLSILKIEVTLRF